MRTRFLVGLLLLLAGGYSVHAQCSVALKSFSIDTPDLVGGSNQSGTGTVTAQFSGNCGTTWYGISLDSDSPPGVLSHTAGVSVNSVQPSTTFTYIAPSVVSQSEPVTINASYNGTTIPQTVTVQPPTLTLTISPSSIVGFSGQVATGTLTVAVPEGKSNVSLSLTANPSSAVNMATGVTIPAGQTQATFTLTGTNVAQAQNVVITATGGSSTSTSVTILPQQISISVDPSVLFSGGAAGTGTVTVTPGIPPGNNYAVQIVASPSGVVSESGVTISGSSGSTANFQVTPDAVSVVSTATLTATWLPGDTATTSVDVFPNHGDLGPCKHCNQSGGDPINFVNGNVWVQQPDYQLPGLGGGLRLARTWNSLWASTPVPASAGAFGLGWWSTYEERLTFPAPGTITYWQGDGDPWLFAGTSSPGAYVLVSPADQRATIQFDSGTDQYTLGLKDGSTHVFNSNGYLISLADRNANRVSIGYDASNRLSTVTDAAGRTLTFNYAGDLPPHSAHGIIRRSPCCRVGFPA